MLYTKVLKSDRPLNIFGQISGQAEKLRQLLFVIRFNFSLKRFIATIIPSKSIFICEQMMLVGRLLG